MSFKVEDFLRNPENYSTDQSREVDELVFKGKIKNGFFIEAGGYDFEDQSTSLYFELKYNWTGLIVEPNPKHYTNGIKKNRKIFSAKTCLSFLPRPTVMGYNWKKEMTNALDKDVQLMRIQCLPLYSLLEAVGNPKVNYLSLDIEGGEFQVLQTLPWEKVDIEVISLESHFLGVRTPGSLEDLKAYMNERGYKHIPGAHKVNQNILIANQEIEGYITNDLFVRNDIAENAGLIHSHDSIVKTEL